MKNKTASCPIDYYRPALMVGTLTLTEMGLDPLTLKISYLASVIGSDVGSLLLPIGTLGRLPYLSFQSPLSFHWFCLVTGNVKPGGMNEEDGNDADIITPVLPQVGQFSIAKMLQQAKGLYVETYVNGNIPVSSLS